MINHRLLVHDSKWCKTQKKRNKPVGDEDHEVLGMRSFGEYTQQTIRELSRPTTSYTFPLLTLHRGKDRVHFSTGFIQKKTLSIPVSCRFFIRKTDEILRTLLLMHDGKSFDKIQPKQVGYFGT
jgi:hypothetical protein